MSQGFAHVVSWGELLWDRMPDGDRLGGCACNVAFHVAQLGAASSLISCVGADPLGQRALACLRDVGVNVDPVAVDDELRTGVVQVSLEGGQPKYTIVERVAWDRIRVDAAAREALQSADALVFGTLAQRTALARGELRVAASLVPSGCIKVCDLNLRSPFTDRDVVLGAIDLADVVKLNSDEEVWLRQAAGREQAVEWMLRERGVRWVVVTCGSRGADVYGLDGAVHYPAESFEPGDDAADAVGAGDAFVAALALGMAMKRPQSDVLTLATRLGGFVASRPGATPALPPQLVQRCRSLLGA